MRARAVVAATTVWLVLVAACTLGANGARQVTNADLRAMALSVRDLPPGFRAVEAKFTNNEELAGDFDGTDEVRGLLERWGRVTGFVSTFTTTVDPRHLQDAVLVSSSVDHYRDVEHAQEAWDGQEGLLHFYKVPIETTSFDAPPLGDRSAALRLTMTTDQGDPIVMYWIYFRRGSVIADVSTVATKDLDDDGQQVIRLARRLNDHVKARLQ